MLMFLNLKAAALDPLDGFLVWIGSGGGYSAFALAILGLKGGVCCFGTALCVCGINGQLDSCLCMLQASNCCIAREINPGLSTSIDAGKWAEDCR